MAYRLERGEGMADGVRRIVAEEVANAVAQLQGRGEEDFDEAVHDARKSLKKSRSALRLVRDDIGQSVRRPENRAMRDVGRRLSPMRDAQVLIETLDKLASRDDPVAPPADATRAFRAILLRRRRQVAEGLRDDNAAVEAVGELEALAERSADWPLTDQGFSSARKALTRSYGRGRGAMHKALDEADDESWHEWRKRVKDLWYALRILTPVAPLQLSGATAEADALSDVLGDHNDIAVLDETLSKHVGELDPAQVELLRAAIVRRRQELRLAAVPLGRRIYGERPGAFAARLSAYWDARAAQDAADAHWLVPEVAYQVRELLAAKEGAAHAAERRRITAALRRLGFRVGDFAEPAQRRGGFAVEDFDRLVKSGVIRIGAHPELSPAAPRREKPPKPGKALSAPKETLPQPRPSANGEASRAELLRTGVALGLGAGRWVRRRLPI